MRIGELAGKSGVSVRALRYYEEQGLLASMRSPGGQRQYRDDAIDRVELIQQLYAAGLPSRTILELLPCVEAPWSLTPAMFSRLSEERARIADQVGRLVASMARLDGIIATAEDHARSSAMVAVAAGDACRSGGGDAGPASPG